MFASLVALDGDERKGLNRMGGESEQLCRQTLDVLGQNPQIVPASVGLADAQADLVALDRLRSRVKRLQKLVERIEDSETALGSGIMSLALEGYALLKVADKNQGLEALRKELSGRFSKSRTQEARACRAMGQRWRFSRQRCFFLLSWRRIRSSFRKRLSRRGNRLMRRNRRSGRHGWRFIRQRCRAKRGQAKGGAGRGGQADRARRDW